MKDMIEWIVEYWPRLLSMAGLIIAWRRFELAYSKDKRGIILEEETFKNDMKAAMQEVLEETKRMTEKYEKLHNLTIDLRKEGLQAMALAERAMGIRENASSQLALMQKIKDLESNV